MKISGFADVCLRILLRVAALGESVTTRDLAEQIHTPYHHVTKAVVELRRRGLITVTRGARGGVAINQAGLDQSVGELLRDLDPHEDVAECTSPAGDCALVEFCQLRGALRQAREAFYRTLDPATVGSMVLTPADPDISVGLPARRGRSR